MASERAAARPYLEDVYLGDPGTWLAKPLKELAERGITVSGEFLKKLRNDRETGNDTSFRIRAQKLIGPGDPTLRALRKDALYLRIAEEGQALQVPQRDNPELYYAKGYTEALATRLDIPVAAVRGAWMCMRSELILTDDDTADAVFLAQAERYIRSQIANSGERGAEIWGDFDCTWKRSKEDFYRFLYEYPSQRIDSPWRTFEVNALRELYFSRVEQGSMLSGFDRELLETYVTVGSFRKGYAATLRDGSAELTRVRNGLPAELTEDHLRIHMRALLSGDLNKKIRHGRD